ncbi:midasin-like [Watersipora subatra]|uniref:midasin-like n=1 Tax=Watersipora subatra TaxID=2589382 RepID=UPI00355AD67D
MLHFFGLETDGQMELLDILKTYDCGPSFLQLTLHIHRLAESQNCDSARLNAISEWAHAMCNNTAFRQGQPFTISAQADTLEQCLPSFDGNSFFMVVSHLLAVDISPVPQSTSAMTDAREENKALHSISPQACVGSYKDKLIELNLFCREVWSHAALLDSSNANEEEEHLLQKYQHILLEKDYIPEEILVNPSVAAALAQIRQGSPLCTGARWVWLGYIQAVSTAPRGVLDPVVRSIEELRFVSEEISQLESELELRNNLALVQSGQRLSKVTHPYYCHIVARLEKLHKRRVELQEDSVHRPINQQFHQLVSEVKGALQSALNYDNLLQLVTGLRQAVCNKFIARANMLHKMLENYIDKIVSAYPLYIDCHQPHINAVKVVCYGVRQMSYTSQLSSDKSLVHHLTNTMSSPAQLYSSIESCSEGLELMRTVVETAEVPDDQRASLSSTYLRLQLAGLCNHAHSSSNIDNSLISKLLELMQCYVTLWRSDNDKRAEKEQEASSLYSYKQHGAEPETDEQILEKLTQQNFPSYHKEFSDLIQSDTLDDSSDDKLPAAPCQDEQLSLSLTEKDMELISEAHCDIMLTLGRTAWYAGDSKVSPPTHRSRSHLMLLNMNHQIVSSMEGTKCFEGSIASKLVHLHLISAGLLSANCHGQELSPTDAKLSFSYDIYRDSNVAEAVRCLEPLATVSTRISELLTDWPDHPLLLQIMSIVERVKSFPVTDALMKFTAGLELILEKLQEWETNAARHVSVQAAMNSVSGLIIEWRKMELDGWRQSLESVAAKICQNSTKYWFHLCSVILPFLREQETQETVSSVELLADIVIQFFESSTIGDFSYRLRLLHAFTIHIALSDCSDSDAVLNSLYSIWEFYKQFEGPVLTYITSKKAGLEKELKNFVKISRWNDMNFWSVRSSVDKAHKTLAKHMKSYHEILMCPARKLFTEDVSQLPSVAEASGDVVAAVTANYICSSTPSNFATAPLELENTSSLDCLPRLPHLAKKFTLACQKISSGLNTYATRSQAINSLSREIIETTNSLQSLHIISGDDKEKQRKQARNIDMRKRKALATLFHTLQKIGFSYRKGNLALQKCEDNSSLLKSGAAQPLNLEVSLSSSHSCQNWVDIWKSAVKYLLRSVTRRTVFLDASSKPSKELGVETIQKLKGFSEHMIDVLKQYHINLCSHTILWTRCREQVLAIGRLSDISEQVPYSFALHGATSAVNSALPALIEHVEELKLLLHSIPPESTSITHLSYPAIATPVSSLSLHSSPWQDMIGRINIILSSLTAVRHSLSSLVTEPVRLYGEQQLSLVSGHMQQLSSVTDELSSLLLSFTTKDGSLVLVKHVRNALKSFCSTLESSKAIIADSQSSQSSLSIEQFAAAADGTVREVLLACQHTVTILDSHGLDETSRCTEPEELIDKHLIDSLRIMDNAMKQVSLSSILDGLSNIASDLGKDSHSDSRKAKANILLSCVPIMHQFISMCQSVLQESWTELNNSLKLLSILYNIFTHLASKGFCLPEELSDELDGDGGGDFNTSDGPGLADGEGAKDVSDTIENEDELDDAKRPEDREKEEKTPDDAPPQEDNGIEMSGDFDGALEDAPATQVDEEDEETSSGDEDEMDEKMGDIGDSDLKEKLDDKLWGEDQDEDDNEEQSKEEETGKGSEETQRELVAKDENPEETTTDQKQREEKEMDDKDINELEKEIEDYNQDELPDPFYNGDTQQQAEEQDGELEMPDELDLDKMEEEVKEDEVADDEDAGMNENTDGVEEMEEDTVEQEPEINQPAMDDNEEGEDDPAHGEKDPTAEESDSPDKQQNIESFGAASQATDEQLVEEMAKDRGGETESKEEQGAGQSEDASQQEVGMGDSYQAGVADDSTSQQENSMERGDKRSDENRTLADTHDSCSVNMDSIQSSSDKKPSAKQNQQPPPSSLYEHITPDQQETSDAKAMDAANEKQAESMDIDQSELELPEETANKLQINDDNDSKKLKPNELTNKLPVKRTDKDGTIREQNTKEEMEDGEQEETKSEEEKNGHGNFVSTIHTSMDVLPPSHQELQEIKEHLELKVSNWGSEADACITEEEAREAWEKYEAVTKTLSHELCEQLRLILEPTQAAKLKGDYRTGKRLNMRKVIAYIASQFRKDSIWLRRTEPSKREYQIAVAVDDSSSMLDNHAKQLSFEALACIANALTYLQVGDMAIASFGEDVKMVHDFSPQFTWSDGGNVLRSFTFCQKKTRVAHMLNSMCAKFINLRRSGQTARHEMAQLLMIVSDGRGLFLEGVEKVKQAVRQALNSGIFLVFVIIDNPNSKDSILDIKMPVFSGTGPPQIKSYMDSFPFPFYVILRDINSLPNTLGDALRQWFELVTSQT